MTDGAVTAVETMMPAGRRADGSVAVVSAETEMRVLDATELARALGFVCWREREGGRLFLDKAFFFLVRSVCENAFSFSTVRCETLGVGSDWQSRIVYWKGVPLGIHSVFTPTLGSDSRMRSTVSAFNPRSRISVEDS